MIGYSDIVDWREQTPANSGAYYCGCSYIRGQDCCPHHGDPVERWPNDPKGDEDNG